MQKKTSKKPLIIVGIISFIVITIGLSVSSNDIKGALKGKVSTTKTTSSSTSSSVTSNVSVSSTSVISPLASQCSVDELQSFSVSIPEITGSDPTNENVLMGEELNAIFDTGSIMNTVLEKMFEAELPNVSNVSSLAIEADEAAVPFNDESGSFSVEYKYNNSNQYAYLPGKFVQKVAVTANDDTIPINVYVELDDGTQFYAYVRLQNPQLQFNVYSSVKGSGYTLTDNSISGIMSNIVSPIFAQGNAYANTGSDSIVEFVKMSGTFDYEDATVKRIVNGNQIDDPILQTVVRGVFEDYPLSATASQLSSSAVSSINSALNNSSYNTNVLLFGKLGSVYSAQKSVADGITTTAVPAMTYYQDSKVKMLTCSSDYTFSGNGLTVPYVRAGTVTNGN